MTAPRDAIARLHGAPGTGVLVVTGGGSGALERLLTVPGASRTLLEARVPYADGALREWLGGVPDRACDPDTARAIAMAAYRRARDLDPAGATFGIGCTASLATDRPKRGEHRVHVALQTAHATHLWSLVMDAGARERSGEEDLCTSLVLDAVAEAKGMAPIAGIELRDSERLIEERHDGTPHWHELLHDRARATHHAFARTPPATPHRRPLLPGAFNPVHDGHLAMARLAEARIGAPTEFELCVLNVDKPPLNYADLERRLARFPEDATIWLTAAPTFVEKAELFPGAVFVVGVDTLVRIAEPRYYDDDPALRDAAMARIGELGSGFLVFGRVDGSAGDELGERFLDLDDLDLPPSLRELCDAVSEAEFRMDVSSSALRSADR